MAKKDDGVRQDWPKETDISEVYPFIGGIVFGRTVDGKMEHNVPHLVDAYGKGFDFGGGTSKDGHHEFGLNILEQYLRGDGYQGPKQQFGTSQGWAFEAAWLWHRQFTQEFILPWPKDTARCVIFSDRIKTWVRDTLAAAV